MRRTGFLQRRKGKIVSHEPQELEDGEFKVVYSGARGTEHARNAVKPRYLKYMSQYRKGEKAYNKTKDEFERSTGLGILHKKSHFSEYELEPGPSTEKA